MHATVLTIPYDSGRPDWRMGLGPDRLLRESIAPLLVRSSIPFRHDRVMLQDASLAEIASAFELCRLVSGQVQTARSAGSFPIVLSGNCDSAIGAICDCGAGKTGMVWFDAHDEVNTPETTRSGFLDGMGIAILTGQCWRTLAGSIPGFHPLPAEEILLIGSRDVETAEESLLARLGVRRSANIAEMRSVLAATASPRDGIYIHFDLDVLDPSEAVWNQWTPANGLKLTGLLEIVSDLCNRFPVKGIGFGSHDPGVDPDGRCLRAAAQIAHVILGSLQ